MSARLATVIFAAVSVSTSSRAGQLQFHTIYPLPSEGKVQTHAVSGNGEYVGGNQEVFDGVTQQYGFVASVEGSQQSVGNLPGADLSGDHTVVYGLSYDGSVAVGRSNEAAFKWTQSGGIQALASVPGATKSWATGTSASGQVVSGIVHMGSSAVPHAVRWNADGSAQLLEMPSGVTFSHGWAVSGDGRFVGGSAGMLAVRWDNDGSAEVLGEGTISGLTDDGQFAVGSKSIGGVARAVVWDETGTMSELGVMGSRSRAFGVSGDGSVIVGGYDAAYKAFMWTEETGVVDMADWLTASGIDLTGWTLGRANAVSRDGSTITGWGQFNGQLSAWAVSGLNVAAVPGAGWSVMCGSLIGVHRRRRRRSTPRRSPA